MMTEEKPAQPKRVGRPPVYTDIVTVSLTIPRETWEYCKSQPGGAAAFLRGLAEAHRQKQKKQTK